jgi:2-C-methyl-D-erythritol 4-phosphate cytidylyltransferase
VDIHAIIVAAGSGERMEGSDSLKQLHLIAGKPMLAWSLQRVADRRNIHGIVIVIGRGMEDEVRAALKGHGLDDVDTFVIGGATRQASVWEGLQALSPDATHVLVHDAARPCASPALFQRMLDALQSHDAVVPVVPAVDTLVIERETTVQAVLDRSEIGAVQTPQVFSLKLLRRAHEYAADNGITAGDDGSLIQAMGEPVATVPGERNNIKVTYPEDLMVADVVLIRERINENGQI